MVVWVVRVRRVGGGEGGEKSEGGVREGEGKRGEVRTEQGGEG